MYVDSHCHLDGPRFADDREAMIERAHARGVETMLAIGIGECPETVGCALPFAEKHDWVYATTGVHPHEAKSLDVATMSAMEKIARHPKVIAWGEIGVDYYYDHSPRDIQKSAFIRQMEAARTMKLPIIIHNRNADNSNDAWDDMMVLLREHWVSSGLGGIMHCFSGGPAEAKASVEIGFMVSFSGNVTFAKAQTIRDAATAIPLDNILTETDSPFLAPVPHRGKRNEPAFVALVAKQLGELRGLSQEEMGELTTKNFYRFFHKSGKIKERTVSL